MDILRFIFLHTKKRAMEHPSIQIDTATTNF